MSAEFLSKRLGGRTEKGLLRSLTVENKLIDFSSNDYLGFAKSAELQSLVASELSSLTKASSASLGSTGSRLLTGNSAYAEELENFIANYHRADAGLIFNSGYDANVGLISAIARKGDVVLYDELSHASIHDGARLSRAASFPFKHNHLEHLEERIKFFRNENAEPLQEIFVIVESVYSMDGDFAPLIEIASLCEKYKANLIVDEAHATGVFGKRGEGKVLELGLEKSVFARVHTFGKALGCHGAIVLGSADLRVFLLNFSRSFIYTTALPIHTLSMIKAAYLSLNNNSDNILKINKLIHLFIAEVKVNKIEGFLPSYSPIQSLICAGNATVKKLAALIQADGFDVRPILSPTVPAGKERIRICLHTVNSEEEIKGLLESLKKNLALVQEGVLANS